MISYRECSLKRRIADGSTRSIKGYCDVRVVFRCENGLVQVLLTNVAHVSDLRYHLFYLPTLAENGHTFKRRPTGVVVRLKSERSIVVLLRGSLYSLCSYWVDRSCTKNACVALQLPNKSAININHFHCPTRHSHDELLRKGAEQKGIALEGELRKCRGGPMAKGLRKGIKQSTHTHEQKRSSGGFSWI